MTSVSDRWTQNLRLRRLVPDDLDKLLTIHTDPLASRYRPGGPPTVAEAEHQLAGFIESWESSGIGYWAVEAHGIVVGCAGLRPLTFAERPCWNLYYRFSPKVWGQGLATEAAHEAVWVAQNELAPRPIVARTRPSNRAAIKVALRVGLVRRTDLDVSGFTVLVRNW